MNKKEILKKVGGILGELNEQYEYLSKNPDNLNDLELELFAANSNFLSDHLSILVKLNDVEPKFSSPIETQKIEREPAASTIEPAPMVPQVAVPEEIEEENETTIEQTMELRPEPGLKFDFEQKPTDKLFESLLNDEDKRIIQDRYASQAAIEETYDEYIEFEEEDPAKIHEAESEENNLEQEEMYIKEVEETEELIPEPIEAKAEEIHTPTVNDLLSKNMSHQTVASQYHSRQTKDLKSMISLNDKLLFVRDLFNGYSLAYSEAVELLNRFDNFESADNFLKQNYAPKNNWASKQDSTDKFYEILNRRFSK